MNAELQAVADRVLERRLRHEPMLALALGRAVQGLPAVDERSVVDAAACFVDSIACLERIDAAGLTDADAAFATALHFDLRNRVDAVDHRSVDSYVTPYRGGDLHGEVRAALAAMPFAGRADSARYLDLLQDYAGLINHIVEHTVAQRAHGILLAAAAVPLARTTAVDLIASIGEVVRPAVPRLSALDGAARSALLRDIARVEDRVLLPALHALRDLFDDGYARHAPKQAGLCHQKGGEAAYRFLIRSRADSDLSPQQIHDIGVESLARIDDEKAALCARLAPGRSVASFEAALRSDRRWIAVSPQDVEASFNDHLHRIEPLLPRWFTRLPQAPHGVARADAAVEAGMSYGYYQRPTPERPTGLYRYNGSNLEARSMLGAQHLIYHELVPGHHLQIALQAEAPNVHVLQPHLQSMAAVEGWAVYASELAREMGVYGALELYGHLVMQSFLAARLVVDTGLNALGWTLQQARDYLREHTFESPALVETETLRYATDIPAQALAYDLGRSAIENARHLAVGRLGSRFDVRAFHDAVLEVGGLPLPVLHARMDAFTRPSVLR